MSLFLKKSTLFLAVMGCLALGIHEASAEEGTVKEDVKKAGRDIKTTAKKTGREIEDKTCHMVKGKLECAGDKVKHKVQNGADTVSDKVEDVKAK